MSWLEQTGTARLGSCTHSWPARGYHRAVGVDMHKQGAVAPGSSTLAVAGCLCKVAAGWAHLLRLCEGCSWGCSSSWSCSLLGPCKQQGKQQQVFVGLGLGGASHQVLCLTPLVWPDPKSRGLHVPVCGCADNCRRRCAVCMHGYMHACMQHYARLAQHDARACARHHHVHVGCMRVYVAVCLPPPPPNVTHCE